MSWQSVDDEIKNLWKALHLCLSFASIDDDIADELINGMHTDALVDKAFEILGLGSSGNPGSWTVSFSDCHSRLLIMPSPSGSGLSVLVPMRPKDLLVPRFTANEIATIKNGYPKSDLPARLAKYYQDYSNKAGVKKVGSHAKGIAVPDCSYGCHHETTGPLPADFNRRC